jgi:hypothetical protein
MDGLAPPDLELFQYTAHIFEFGKSQGRPALLGHTKIESTVRYVGIEVDDGWNKSISEIPGQSGHALPAL